MTRIAQVLAAPATGAYYYEDLTALQAHPLPMGERYGILRGVAEGVSVGLMLDDGQIAWGDCMSVAYSSAPRTTSSGKAGRAAAFRTDAGLAALRDVVAPALRGRELTSFRNLAVEIDALTERVEVLRPATAPDSAGQVDDPSRRQLLKSVARLLSPYPDEEVEVHGSVERVTIERPLHPAVRYGVSQALLQAVALTRRVTMAEVIADEWDLPRPAAPAPIHAQSGSERYMNADKMIVRRVASLPHALVDDIPEQVGRDGAKLIGYLHWLRSRVVELGGEDYFPTLHLDVHGALGQIFENNLGKVLGQLYAMELAAQPFSLRVECPVLMESREAQIETMKTLREYVGFRKMSVQLVADEWANTLDDIRAFVETQAADMIQIKMPDLGSVHNAVEAALACQAGGVGAFLGGSCAETDLSARVAVHVALATRPDILMARPGLGVDEAISITQNEMNRTLAWMRAREA